MSSKTNLTHTPSGNAYNLELKIDPIELLNQDQQGAYQSMLHQSFDSQNKPSKKETKQQEEIKGISDFLIGETTKTPKTSMNNKNSPYTPRQLVSSKTPEPKLFNPIGKKNESKPSNIKSELFSSYSSLTTDNSDLNLKRDKSEKNKEEKEIEIRFLLEKSGQKQVETSFILPADKNEILNQKSEILPNISFDVNRTYSDDPNTYVKIDFHRKTIKNKEGKSKELEKIFGSLKVKLTPEMKEKSQNSLDDNDKKIVLCVFRADSENLKD